MATEHAPAAADAAHGAAAHADGHEHPGWSTYWKIAVILFVITGIEVSAFYIPAWETSWIYVPSMLFLSTIKFVLVVMFYMHLKYDHKLFRALFSGPLIVAALTLVGLLFLFSKLSIRLGLAG
jgi:cytochrome c oxidase subunit 4